MDAPQSYTYMLAKDLLEEKVHVINKRYPFFLVGVDGKDQDAIVAILSDIYGADTLISVMTGDGKAYQINLGMVFLEGENNTLGFAPEKNLTDHKRFDFSDLEEILIRLRGEGGCEWDRAQTHESIRINLIEEAYELVEAIDLANKAMLLEETGDVLLQAVFHTQIAKESGEFNYSDMLSAVCKKLIDRHTHIFGTNHANNAEEALNFWTEAKKKEKKYLSSADAMDRVPKNLPALLYAEKIQKIAKKVNFDFPNAKECYAKVLEELDEFNGAVSDENRVEEAGDILFSVVNLLRFYKIEPEMALADANRKFFKHFDKVEQIVTSRGKKMEECTLDELDEIWNSDEVRSAK